MNSKWMASATIGVCLALTGPVEAADWLKKLGDTALKSIEEASKQSQQNKDQQQQEQPQQPAAQPAATATTNADARSQAEADLDSASSVNEIAPVAATAGVASAPSNGPARSATGSNAGTTTLAEKQYKSIGVKEFMLDSWDMLGQLVELNGDFYSFMPVTQTNHATIAETGSRSMKVDLFFSEIEPRAFRWFISNDCMEKCGGAYLQGRVIMSPIGKVPALALHSASSTSVASGDAVVGEALLAIDSKEQYGIDKPLLPSGGVPTEQQWKAWSDRVPPSARGYDSAMSMWENMNERSNYMVEQSSDQAQAIIRGPDRPADFETYYRGTRDTGLRDLFKAAPYIDNSTAWPRVAIQIEERPAVHGHKAADYGQEIKTKGDACWRLRATVWIGPMTPTEISSFNWCLSETRYNTPYFDVPMWGAAQKSNMIIAGDSTGVQRTKGPKPPNKPLPNGDGYDSQFSYATLMIGNVLLDMGFVYTVSDGRVWFNE